jgi:hypothetical protein
MPVFRPLRRHNGGEFAAVVAALSRRLIRVSEQNKKGAD